MKVLLPRLCTIYMDKTASFWGWYEGFDGREQVPCGLVEESNGYMKLVPFNHIKFEAPPRFFLELESERELKK